MSSHFYEQLAALADLGGFALTLGIGILVLHRWKSKPIRFWFAVNCFTAALWNLSYFAGPGSSSKELFLLTLWMGGIGWIFLGPCLFIFLAFFLGRERLVRTRWRRLFFLGLALPFWLAYLVNPERFTPVFPAHGHYVSILGEWFYLLLPSILGWAAAQVWVIFSSFHHQSDPRIRQRSYWIGISLLLLYIPALITDVLLPALNFILPGMGSMINGLFCLIVFASIQRFQLLPSPQVLLSRVDQLQEFNRELERQVEERTRALKESEQRYREIFENVQDFIFSLDLEGRFTSANPQMERVTGVREKGVVGRSLFQVIGENTPPHLLEEWNRNWKDIQAQIHAPGNLYRNEVLMPTPSGEGRNVTFTWSGIFREGKLVGYLGLGRDVTESKRAEKALRESEERYREIFDNVQEMIQSMDLEGRIVSGNPRVRTLVGGDPEQNQGRLFSEVIADNLPPAILEKWQKAWQQIRQGIQKPGDVFQEEVTVPIPSGEFKTLALTYSGIFRQDRLAGYLQMGRDITESERLKRALKEYSANLEQLVAERTRELEASYTKLAETARLAGKAEVAAGVLHNIGNAINSIGVRLDVVKNHVHHHCGMEVLASTLSLIEQNRDRLGPFWLEDPKGSKVLPFLRELAAAHARSREELKEALRFVQDQVQHIAEIMAVEQRYHRPGILTEPTDLNRLIREALEMTKDSLGRRGVAVEQDLAELPLLKLDRAQMMQVVFNLLKNAAEALEKNPEGERRVKVSTRMRPEPESGMEIVVEDNGAGIRVEDRPRLFQFGFTTKADRGGHGFGLHTSANFIQSLGGVIEAESEGPGQGSSFRVRLPLNPEPAALVEKLEEKEMHDEPAYFGH